MRECLVCGIKISKDAKWPICSEICFFILTQAINHKETSCWISCEVYCQNSFCVSFDKDGAKNEYPIFKIERVIKERGLNKEELIGNY